MENVLILHVFGVLCVSPCMHGGRSHTECCSPVSAITGPHKHGVRGESVCTLCVCVCVCVCVGENGREREVREGSLQRARGQAVDTRSISLLLSLFLSLFHTHTHALRCTHTQGYSEVI